jgi:hypothetical protein
MNGRITAITVLLALGGGRRVDWLYADDRFAYVRTVFLGAIHALAIATVPQPGKTDAASGHRGDIPAHD